VIEFAYDLAMETGVSIIVALIAASVALIGIIVQQRNSNRHRFTDRKLSLFVDFWVECQRHAQQVANVVAWRFEGRHGDPPTVSSTEAAERAKLAIDLLSNPAVRKAANELFKVTVLLGSRFAGDSSETDENEWKSLLQQWDLRAKDFLATGQLDLREPRYWN